MVFSSGFGFLAAFEMTSRGGTNNNKAFSRSFGRDKRRGDAFSHLRLHISRFKLNLTGAHVKMTWIFFNPLTAHSMSSEPSSWPAFDDPLEVLKLDSSSDRSISIVYNPAIYDSSVLSERKGAKNAVSVGLLETCWLCTALQLLGSLTSHWVAEAPLWSIWPECDPWCQHKSITPIIIERCLVTRCWRSLFYAGDILFSAGRSFPSLCLCAVIISRPF